MVFLILSLVASIDASAQEKELIPVDSCIKKGTLNNGMTYYLRYNNWPENRACFYLVQKVGSLQEDDNQRGLAHFLEHMCFKGSEHFKGNEIEHFCERLGVDNGGGVNAYTSIEETVYNIDNVPTDVGQEYLDSCLLVLYDWANALSLDSIEIEKERGVIHEEWRMGRDATERILDRQLPTLYPNSKYGHRMPIGLMEVVDNFDHQELRDFYRKWYNAQNQCIVVVGDIDVCHIEDKIKELFDSVKIPIVAEKAASLEIDNHKGIIYSIDKDKELQDNWVQVTFKHEAYTPDDRKYIQYLRDIYKTNAAIYMLNSRYDDEALVDGCPYMTASADDDDYWYSSSKAAFSLSAYCKDGMQEKALASIIAKCRQATTFGFTNEEYNRYKDEYLSSLDNSLMSSDKRQSRRLVKECYNNFLYGSDMSSTADYVAIMKEIIEITPLDSINSRMRELFPDVDDNMVILSWNVEKNGVHYPTKKSLHKALTLGRNAKICPYVDDLKDAKLISEEPVPGKVKSQTSNIVLGYKKLSLSNGATVLLKHTEIDKSQVLFKAYGEAGWSMYSDEDDANINLFNSISFGNNGHSVSNVNKILAGKRINLSHSISQRAFTFTGSFNPNDTEAFMQLLYADFTNQSNDENEFRNLIDETKISLTNRRNVPESAFADSVSLISVNHHPRFKLLEADDLKLVSLDRELEIYKDQTSDPSKYTFIFVGNYDESILIQNIEKYIASLPTKKEINKGDFIKTWLQEDVCCHFSREMETPKSIVQMEWFTESIPYSIENKIKAEIACRVLNMLYSKIVREENSAAYDCSADFYFIRGTDDEVQCGFEATCSMNPELTDSVVAIMKQEFVGLQDDIDDSNFANAKESMLKSFDELVKIRNGFWVDAVWQFERYNIDTYSSRKEMIDNVKKEDVMDFIKILLHDAHKTEILMTPR